MDTTKLDERWKALLALRAELEELAETNARDQKIVAAWLDLDPVAALCTGCAR